MEPSHQSLVEAAFKRNNLIGESQELPSPFFSYTGATEQVTSYFFWLNSQRLIAAKTTDDNGVFLRFWEAVERSTTENCPSTLRPLASNKVEDGVLLYDDGISIVKVLERLKLNQNATLPKPSQVLSGLAGYSRLYLFKLKVPGSDRPRDVLIKFDRPDRLANEWKAIEQVRQWTGVPPELQLPLSTNSYAEDGIVVTVMFQNKTVHGEIVQLNEVLIDQLVSNLNNANQTIFLLEQFLERLYQERFEDLGSYQWQELNQDLVSSGSALPRIFKDAGLLKKGKQSLKFPGFSSRANFPNPLSRLSHYLQKPVGKTVHGISHGDIQSTNILVALGPYNRPQQIAAIDIEKLRTDQPLVEDLVRIEVDFWRSVYTAIAREHFQGRSEKKIKEGATTAMLLALDQLEARAGRNWPADEQILNLAQAAGQFVLRLRTMAWGFLRGNQRMYFPKDYFSCLRFFYLKALLRPLANKDPLKVRIVALGASLAEQVVQEMKRGEYTEKRKFTRKWNPGKISVAAKPNAVRRKKSSGGYATSLGSFSRVFQQEGMVIPALHEVFFKEDAKLILSDESERSEEMDFTFADERLVRFIGKLNARAYRRMRWRGTGTSDLQNFEEKRIRNLSHFRKNPFCLLLIKAFDFEQFKPGNVFIGYTHLVPLNQRGYDDYCAGKIPDNVLGQKAIAGPNEAARAVILFSIVADTKQLREAYGNQASSGVSWKKGATGFSWKYEVGRHLIHAIAFHLGKLMQVHGNVDEMEVLVQNDSDLGLLTLFNLMGFEETSNTSGDGLPIRKVLCKRLKSEA